MKRVVKEQGGNEPRWPRRPLLHQLQERDVVPARLSRRRMADARQGKEGPSTILDLGDRVVAHPSERGRRTK